jgi:hypothetical protein
MTEIKTSCPKCGGHIAFPPETAGQEASCPHCNEVIVLGKKSSVTAWILTAAAVIGLICLGTVVVLKHPPKPGKPAKNLDAERHLSPIELLQSKAANQAVQRMSAARIGEDLGILGALIADLSRCAFRTTVKIQPGKQ